MTEEERRQQDWVELRADCTEQGIFDRIADTVERDVERFNKFSSKKRRDRTFKCERNELASLYVGEVNDDGALIRKRAVRKSGFGATSNASLRSCRNGTKRCSSAI